MTLGPRQRRGTVRPLRVTVTWITCNMRRVSELRSLKPRLLPPIALASLLPDTLGLATRCLTLYIIIDTRSTALIHTTILVMLPTPAERFPDICHLLWSNEADDRAFRVLANGLNSTDLGIIITTRLIGDLRNCANSPNVLLLCGYYTRIF